MDSWIKENTKENDIIVTRNGLLSAVITSLTGRRTTSGMFPEMKPEYSLAAAEDFIKNNGTIEVEQYHPNMRFPGKEIARFGSIMILNISSI